MSSLENIISFAICLLVLVVCLRFLIVETREARKFYGNDPSEAKRRIQDLNSKEITTAFISFGGTATGIAKSLGFRNILDVSSSASELRKAFDCLSKSVIESSKSVVADGDNFFI